MVNADDIDLARRLERCEMPADGFPHASHLRVAWVYLNESPTIDDAVARMTATLRRVTASVGKADKYSAPITVFWMLQLAAVRALMPDAPLERMLRAYPRLLNKSLIRADEPAHVIASDSADSSSNAPDRPLPGAPA
jgi:hypothetical protein